MTGPKEEWLEWDRRFQFGYSCLNQRLKTTEEATQQIAQLEQQTNLLLANSKILEEANDGLRDRILKLEQASYQTTHHKEQILDLTASSRNLKEESNALNDRIVQLEHEGSHRHEENQLVQQHLKEKISAQEDNHRSVIVSVRGMHEIAMAERDHRGEEIQRLRSQLDALLSARRTTRGHGRAESRRISPAPTGDERTPISQHAVEQPNAVNRDIEVRGVLIKAQGSFTLFEDHLRYAEEAFRRHETEAVQAFVNSIQDSYRISLGKKLEELGDWTWQAVREESYRILETEKKAKRRSARLLAVSAQPS